MSKTTSILQTVALTAFCFTTLGCSEGNDGLFLGLSVSPASVNFGAVPVNLSQQLELRVANPSQQRVEYRVSLQSANAFSFEISGDMALEPQEEAKLTVTFSPTEPGEQSTNLEIKNSASDRSTVVNLQGNAVQARLTAAPSDLDFGQVVVNTVASRTVTLTNGSAADVVVEVAQLNGVKACGTEGGELYCLVPPVAGAALAYPIAANSSIEVEVQFSSDTAEGRERASFKAAACELPQCQVEVTLNALSVITGFSCNDPLDFGQVNPGACADRKMDCTNNANAPVTVRSWALSADSSQDFEVSGGPGLVLRSGESLAIDARYCPGRLGSAQGRVDVVLAELNSPFGVQLLGTAGGPDIDVSHDVIDFGLTTLVAPARRSLLVANVGTDTLRISDILPDENGTGAFFIGPGASDIAPGESQTITIQFLPAREGPIESALVINSNDSDETETRVRLIGEGIDLPPCNYDLQPMNINFGSVVVGQSLTRHAEVTNEGRTDCLVGSAIIEPGSDSEFTASPADQENRILRGGSSTTLAATYTPLGVAENRGALAFSISDPIRSNPSVPLLGASATAGLGISPRELNFGTVNSACIAPVRTVRLTNNGMDPAVIDSIGLTNGSNSAFAISAVPAPLPGSSLTIPSGTSVEFSVSASGQGDGQLAGAVEIIGQYGGQPASYIVPLRIDVTTDGIVEERFGPTNTKTDILFVVDNSCSLAQEHAQLAESFEQFISAVPQYNVDYQIGVTTTDVLGRGEQGRLLPLATGTNRIITPNTSPDPLAVFRARVLELATNGSGIEAGLEAAYLALSAPNVGNHNAGFLRPDARLSLVFVTDEPDSSPRSDSFYANYFHALKGGPRSGRLAINVIAGDVPGGCNGPGGSAGAAPRLTGLIAGTDGVFESVCRSAPGGLMQHLAEWGGGLRRRLWLNGAPVASSLSVMVDGVPLPATSSGGVIAWSYDEPTRVVHFTTFAAPDSNADVVVRYAPVCL